MKDIIFITGEEFFDHPQSGIAILKRLLEKEGYSVGIIEQPTSAKDITKLGDPKLFFGVSSGAIDSMVRNYTPLKKSREDDEHSNYEKQLPDRAVIVYCDMIKQHYKNTKIVLGGTESSLRRFTHYDYWSNKLRKPILFDTRADILSYGNSEKQIIEIANKIKNKEPLENIEGTCIISKEVPKGFETLPEFQTVTKSKTKFCDQQNRIKNNRNLAQKIDNRYVIQYKSPIYTSKDIDSYYELPFERNTPHKGFKFSVITHRGCIGNCNFCAINLLQGDKIISRSKESIMNELKYITTLKDFEGIIDDFGGPSANMYGMDCNDCKEECISCNNLDKSLKKQLTLLRTARKVPNIQNIYIKSGIRYDLCTKEYLKEVLEYHTLNTLRIAPEHVSKNVLKLMNKDQGNLKEFLNTFKELNTDKELSYYFMTAHPGSSVLEAKALAKYLKNLNNSDSVQIFTPTPMTNSTCMYYTGLNPKNKTQIYVPYSFKEKKDQKRVIFKKD